MNSCFEPLNRALTSAERSPSPWGGGWGEGEQGWRIDTGVQIGNGSWGASNSFLTRIGNHEPHVLDNDGRPVPPLLHWRRGLGRGGHVFFVIVLLNLALNPCYALRFM